MALSNPLHTLLRRSEFWSQHLSHLPARRPLKFYGVGTGLILAVGGASSCTWRRTETTFVMMLSEFSSSSDSGTSLPARWEQSASLWSSFEKCSGWGRLEIQMKISSKKRLYLFGRTYVRGRWILRFSPMKTDQSNAPDPLWSRSWPQIAQIKIRE